MTYAPLPDPSWFVGKLIPSPGDYRIVERIDSGRFGHVLKAHSNTLNRDIACKIVPKTHLVGATDQPPRWTQEITNANQIPSNRVVKIFATGEWNTPVGDFVYLLQDFVRGQSLRQYLSSTTTLEVGFVLELVQVLLDFLNELKALGLQHGDIHSGNILVEDRSHALHGRPHEFRITDFGVSTITTGQHDSPDDFEQLAVLLRTLLGKIDRQKLRPDDRALFDYLRHDFLAKKVTEHDGSYDSCAQNPRELYLALDQARHSSIATSAQSAAQLTTPFDYLSCEQIGEAHSLLKELYSDKMLGLPGIEDRNNLVLTGPRGCGKTTVFRCLSLKHLTRTDADGLDAVRYIGIYYRCDDLYFNFPRFQPPERAEGIDVPMHFITSTLLRELLEAVSAWMRTRCPESWREGESSASKRLWSALRLTPPKHPLADTFGSIANALERERERASRKQRVVNSPTEKFGHYFGPELLPMACSILATCFPELASRPVYFLVDDYSAPKISTDLQKNLNRLLMQRSASCFFKLATESPTSYCCADIDGKTYVEGREFRLVNLGMDFIHADPGDKLRFVDDVFNRRFLYAPTFPIRSLHDLIGNDENLDYNDAARQYKEGRHPLVWGRSALAELCSGDVHFLIDLASKMVSAAGGSSALVSASQTPAIAADVQTKAIRTEGGNFLKNLRSLPEGPRLVEIVEAFGSVASSYVRHKLSKNEENSPPHQACRIEPYEDPRLEGDSKKFYDELLRYSVFLEDVRGKSRRGFVVPRLYLRRFLIPFFNLTFSKRDSLELDPEEFHCLLTKPKEFEKRKRLRGPDAGTPSDDGGQMNLLPT
jgi:serine/threonine protein kinase